MSKGVGSVKTALLREEHDLGVWPGVLGVALAAWARMTKPWALGALS